MDIDSVDSEMQLSFTIQFFNGKILLSAKQLICEHYANTHIEKMTLIP